MECTIRLQRDSRNGWKTYTGDLDRGGKYWSGDFELSHQQNQKVMVGRGKIMRRDRDLVLIGSPIMT